jgi:hypothetical protein
VKCVGDIPFPGSRFCAGIDRSVIDAILYQLALLGLEFLVLGSARCSEFEPSYPHQPHLKAFVSGLNQVENGNTAASGVRSRVEIGK